MRRRMGACRLADTGTQAAQRRCRRHDQEKVVAATLTIGAPSLRRRLPRLGSEPAPDIAGGASAVGQQAVGDRHRVSTFAAATLGSTTTPITMRVSAPAPLDKIRRRRLSDASSNAASKGWSQSRSWLANSTIRMPFLAASADDGDRNP